MNLYSFFKHSIIAASITSVFAANIVLSSEGHSDIDVTVDAGQIVMENAEVLSNGFRIFESEFGELGNPYATDDPGFVVEDGTFSAGQLLGFEGLGPLQFWNGSQWTVPVGGESIEVIDVLSDRYFFDALSSPSGVGFVDAADPEGGIHSHVEFEIGAGAGTPTSGAYLIELALSGYEADQITQAYADSESFFIAFNLGMDEVAFEASIDALASIPLPAGLPLMLSGMIGLFACTYRKKFKKA